MPELIVRPFVDPALGNSSYLVSLPGAGIAAVIDPQRDVAPYLQVARELNVHIAYALETHLHADFVSGARELRARVLGEHPQAHFVIGASAGAELEYEHTPLGKGTCLEIADWEFRALETPGHTPEHISFLILHRAKPHSVFTGGTLLVGGAGRTDHLGDALTLPLAHQLYHSIQKQLLALPDDVIVYPTHGAGSFCNSAVSSRRVTTIGNERWNNRFALASAEEEFIKVALEGLGSYPEYFHYLREFNRRGPRLLSEVEQPKLLTPIEVQTEVARGAVLVDLRTPRAFAKGHLAGSFGIPFASPAARWIGWVVPFGKPIILIADNKAERAETIRHLLSIGFENIRGYMDGVATWQAEGLPLVHAGILPQPALREWIQSEDRPLLVDVRFADEYSDGHLPLAQHIEAGELTHGNVRALPKDQPIVVYCRSGNRATVGYSLLERRGYQNVLMLEGGYMNWRANGFETVGEFA